MHYHSSLEVNSIHAAAGSLLLNGNWYPLEKLRLVILPPGCLHGYQIEQSAGWIDVYHIWPKGMMADPTGSTLYAEREEPRGDTVSLEESGLHDSQAELIGAGTPSELFD